MEAIAGTFALMAITMVAVMVGSLVLWVWAVIDVVRVKHDFLFRAGDRTVWVLIVLLGGPLGAVIYVAVGRPRTAFV